MNKWKEQMERAWAEADIPPDKKEEYRKELRGVRKQLVDASGDDRTFRTVTNRLIDTPPSFEVKLP
jgi:hypothetical protein